MIVPLWPQLVEIRRKGYRPEIPVIVSLVGNVKHEYPVLVIPDGSIQDMDLRVLVTLDVIIAHVGKSLGRLMALTDAVVRAGARDLYLWNVANDDSICVLLNHEKILREVPCV